MENISAYCEFDMTNVEICNPQLIKGRNRSIIAGTCKKCGNIAYRILSGANEQEIVNEQTQGEQQTSQSK
ncbi:Hypothetical protein PACV_254 [Pacmanvirus A23]|uniref:Hypothetical protein n=1 Tax=Pacmanvirus A23 TaxID=1932881 RepID=UPI000A093F46|nr:Hypothetical protein B9W72_gp252 [Pacmanvirus A23]SIP85969.1 Hypothetical protein PACV_254 [Pacmanvirus A23]